MRTVSVRARCIYCRGPTIPKGDLKQHQSDVIEKVYSSHLEPPLPALIYFNKKNPSCWLCCSIHFHSCLELERKQVDTGENALCKYVIIELKFSFSIHMKL